MLKLDDWITSSDKYLSRAKSTELTTAVKENAADLILRVNKLLIMMGRSETKVSSGFRPSDVNSKITNAAKKSNHMIGNAIDLVDVDNSIDEWCLANLSKLKECGLYLESPNHTLGWCHLQRIEPGSGNRVFLP